MKDQRHSPGEVFPADAGHRKVVLTRMLAEAEVKRLGITPTHREHAETALWWQQEFDIEDPARFGEWLRFAGLDMERFSAMMWRFAALTKLVDHYRAEIDARIPDHLAIHTIHEFVRTGDDNGV